MGEAARRRIDGREDSEPEADGGAVPVDWFVDPVDQARGAAGVTTLDDLASAFLAAHPEVAGDVLLRSDRPRRREPEPPVQTPQNLSGTEPHDAQGVDASVWQAVAGLYSVSEGDAEGELAWQTDALCAQTDPEAFFPEKGGSTRDAKRVCEACPVSGQCLDYAMTNDEKFGIWGGLSERERRRLRRRGR
ncbi:WhiB family transcriptional regulator [Kocuria sp.]|uniref:WhiB family transcriptional regulator n=1 Tax=Kocuria sp. TaxID=1871328 RepID=UPI0026DD7FCB|nr:WhiB family transcriptional regulator [Kocuria sp.]MDO4919615.1 WhiB family transcriptional regulator [Kocuria sp.]